MGVGNFVAKTFFFKVVDIPFPAPGGTPGLPGRPNLKNENFPMIFPSMLSFYWAISP
jgi:hypothetical protein